MKIIISPAKSLDFESDAKTTVFTQASFLKRILPTQQKTKGFIKIKIE